MTFAALSDVTRRAILGRLMHGEVCLSDLAKPFEMTQTAVSKRVHILNKAGLLVVEKRGRTRHCWLNPEVLKEASEWLQGYESFLNMQFDSLKEHFERERPMMHYVRSDIGVDPIIVKGYFSRVSNASIGDVG